MEQTISHDPSGASSDLLVCKNPSTGEPLRKLKQTPLESIPHLIQVAREAQKVWSDISVKKRCQILSTLCAPLLTQLDEVADLICLENGKPRTEAVVHDILPIFELIKVYSKRAPRLLRQKSISLRFMKHKKSYLIPEALGVVAVISPWNFPFSIPMGEVLLALMAGNAVILKPSEHSTLIALKLIDLLHSLPLPPGLVQIVIGDGQRGSKIVDSGVDKICFTGSVSTGKKVMVAAAAHLTPVILELGGKDPMIVLEDSDLDFATSAALWGAFANSGQVCASTERLLVHESIKEEFLTLLQKKLKILRPSEVSSNDLPGVHPKKIVNWGSITMPSQKNVYKKQLAELEKTPQLILSGGQFQLGDRQLEPTIIDCSTNETLSVYTNETFGPVLAVTTFSSDDDAVAKANRSQYGLLASVISGNISRAEKLASRLEAGSILINDVLYTHAIPETPWGGIKNTGFGVVHSDRGLLEFVRFKHIHTERFPFLRIKPLWWFPYTENQYAFFKNLMVAFYSPSWIQKISALPDLVIKLLKLFFLDKRI